MDRTRTSILMPVVPIRLVASIVFFFQLFNLLGIQQSVICFGFTSGSSSSWGFYCCAARQLLNRLCTVFCLYKNIRNRTKTLNSNLNLSAPEWLLTTCSDPEWGPLLCSVTSLLSWLFYSAQQSTYSFSFWENMTIKTSILQFLRVLKAIFPILPRTRCLCTSY